MSNEPPTPFLLYQTSDGQTRLEVRLENETVWLSLNQLAELFQRDKSVISRHIKNVFEEGELKPEATVAKFATVQAEGGKQVARVLALIHPRDGRRQSLSVDPERDEGCDPRGAVGETRHGRTVADAPGSVNAARAKGRRAGTGQFSADEAWPSVRIAPLFREGLARCTGMDPRT